jgi:hypothetical protein
MVRVDFFANSTQPILRVYAKIIQNHLDLDIVLKKPMGYRIYRLEIAVLIYSKLSEIVR